MRMMVGRFSSAAHLTNACCYHVKQTSTLQSSASGGVHSFSFLVVTFETDHGVTCTAHADLGMLAISNATSKQPIPESAAAKEFHRFSGPKEGTKEHKALETCMGFSFCTVLGELLYAYVVGRMDIGYAVVKLAKASGICDEPASPHILESVSGEGWKVE